MKATQAPTSTESKSDSESVTPDPQLLEQIKNLHVEFFDGNRLSLTHESADHLPAIARLCSKTVTRIGISQMLDKGYRDCHFEQLQQFPNLRELAVIGGDLTDASLLCISNLKSLIKLDIETLKGDRLTERGFKQLTRLRNAQLVKLPSSWPTGWIAKRERVAAQSKVTAMLQQALPDAVVVW